MSALDNDILISSVESNGQWLDGGAMFGNAPRTVWEKWIEPDSQGRIPLACRCLLVEWNGLKILCETGIGAFFDPKMAERFGVQNSDKHMLIENLSALNIKLEDIDYVILSHLHFDHAGGLLKAFDATNPTDRSLIFPKAKFIVGLEAWERAQHPHPRDRASFIPGLEEALEQSNRLIVIGRNPMPNELAQRIEWLTTNGHTPGQLHVVFKGKERNIMFCGDLVPGEAWVHVPITMGYDRNAELVIDEKTQVYQRALTEHWELFFTHDAKIASGRLQRDPKNGRYSLSAPHKTWKREPLGSI